MDIVEVSPPYDHAEVTAMAANRVALELISRARAQAGGTAGSTLDASHRAGRIARARPTDTGRSTHA